MAASSMCTLLLQLNVDSSVLEATLRFEPDPSQQSLGNVPFLMRVLGPHSIGTCSVSCKIEAHMQG